MGVPEQLRRLDEDLATGRVDAESYRRRRDELLATRLPAPPPPAPPRTDPAPDDTARDDTELDDTELDDSELDAAERELGVAPEFDEPYREPRRDTATPTTTADPTPATTGDDPDAEHPRGIPVPPPADAPPLPGTPASSPGLRPPPPPPEDDDAVETDERPLPADPFPPPFRWSSPDDPDGPDQDAS
ncbi:MAG TPA: hypothetical protein VK935_02700, partial [Actinomycetospora sp.]|nr:hypothetical protein [Actinomycetospora sp.]